MQRPNSKVFQDSQNSFLDIQFTNMAARGPKSEHTKSVIGVTAKSK